MQTVDFFTPIVDDPYQFGRIAAANALSDVYAMGGEPYSAMNIVCFPKKTMPLEYLQQILLGGQEQILAAGAVPAGGHSLEDEEVKYGLAVSGIVDPESFASNRGFHEGDLLALTKPIGTGVLSTAIKGEMGDVEALEAVLVHWTAMLNDFGGKIIRDFGLRGATDVTGFGLGGHLLEAAQASKVRMELSLADVPFIEEAVEMATLGMMPAGSYANKNFCGSLVGLEEGADSLRCDLLFDAQTSGGLILSVPEEKAAVVMQAFEAKHAFARIIGRVEPRAAEKPTLRVLRSMSL